MRDILVICRNCNNVEKYDEDYMTLKRRKYHKCGVCGNSQKDFAETKKWVNELIKKYNYEEIINLINEDKYNEKLFKRNKGFEYKKECV